MKIPISVVLNLELYGEVIDDCDGGKEFLLSPQAGDDTQLMLWVGDKSVFCPRSIFDNMSGELRARITKQAIKNVESELLA